ncbi:hypothetical protein [Bordetella hinzii]|uniref:hypothetical protein n=1 Tax=Bordetella hinzii TaxID=103855 RepID=UPI0021AF4646|nr:hypothetical protein [Bordetella hinzii]
MRTSTLQRKTPMRRSKPKREKGLGHKLEVVMGFYRPPGHKLPTLLRSEQHRRNVAALPCACCGKSAPSQCAHANFSKAAAMKACDSLTFPLCPECHRHHDQGGMSRQERRLAEWEYADGTRAALMQLGQWGPEIELHYQKAILPLRRLVHGD